MITQLDPEALYWATFNRFELRIPGDAINDIAQSGRNDEAVEYWTPTVREQACQDGFANAPTADRIREELREYGAWDDEELQDNKKNWQRLVWIACHNIAEEDEPDCSDPVR